MTTTQLEYFLTIGDTLNFTKAAELLFVSQSGLSRQIAALEKELGVQLFSRGRRGLSFTPAGQIFYSALKPQAEDFKMLIRRVGALRENEPLRVSMGLADLGMIQPKQQALVDMLREPPLNAEISVASHSLDDLVSLLLQDSLDLAFLPKYAAEENAEALSFFELTKNPMCLVYSSPSVQEPVTLASFRNTPIIASLQPHRDALTELCRPYGFVPTFVPLSAADVIVSISIRGYALLTPEWSLLSRGRFNTYVIPDFPPDIDVLAWKKTNLNPAISFIEANRSLIAV